MAGIIPFVRGIDFTSYDLKDKPLPERMKDMSGAHWIKLDKTNLSSIPDEITHLKKLEEIFVSKNQLTSLDANWEAMPHLKTICASRNKLVDSSIPKSIFNFDDLSVLDLSHNNLTAIPDDLENSKNILVLNLGNNNISTIPVQLFINLSDLLHLDLSNNEFESLPPQMRRLIHLKVLILDGNPLLHAQLRQLPSMVELTTLSLRNTQRNLSNFPANLNALRNLVDVNLAHNSLTRVPDSLYALGTLERLNLSYNEIDEVSLLVDSWVRLQTLNLSNNLLTSLPASISKLQALRRLYINDNKLDFEGIPTGIGKLLSLEHFSASDNILEIVPESLFRCIKLKKLILANNQLVSLPVSVHHLPDLQTLDVRGNPDLVMPPKPSRTTCTAANREKLYDVDFSLSNQLRLLGVTPPGGDAASPSVTKDPVARRARLRRRREADMKAKQVLLGMNKLTSDKQKDKDSVSLQDSEISDTVSIASKKWDESLSKPNLDYADIFSEEVGQFPGLTVWQIDLLNPAILDDAMHGKFYISDCYIVLHTEIDESGNLSWEIYYWIGERASIDKKACSAIHAVNLRNMLGATGRTIREEMNDESEQFIQLFDCPVSYIEGGTESGLYAPETINYSKRYFWNLVLYFGLKKFLAFFLKQQNTTVSFFIQLTIVSVC